MSPGIPAARTAVLTYIFTRIEAHLSRPHAYRSAVTAQVAGSVTNYTIANLEACQLVTVSIVAATACCAGNPSSASNWTSINSELLLLHQFSCLSYVLYIRSLDRLKSYSFAV